MNNKPTFRRQGAPRKGKMKGQAKIIKKGWRKPRGIYSHQRDGFKWMGNKPKIGYRNDKDTRDMHPSGLYEILIKNIDDLKKADPKKNIARIASAIGNKKKIQILEEAKKIGLKVTNKMVTKKVKKIKKKTEKKDEKKETKKEEKKEDKKTEKKEDKKDEKVKAITKEMVKEVKK